MLHLGWLIQFTVTQGHDGKPNEPSIMQTHFVLIDHSMCTLSDAIALLLASNLPDIHLLGVSTVHGNASAENTLNNATRLLHAFSPHLNLIVYPGATKPLIRPSRY